MDAGYERPRLNLDEIPYPTVIYDLDSKVIVHLNAAASALQPGADAWLGRTLEESLLGPDRVWDLRESEVELEGERMGVAQFVGPNARAELELARLEDSFEAMADQVPGALFRWRLRPDGTDAITCMNEGCVALWEVGPEAIQEDAAVLWDMVDPEDVGAMRSSLAASAEAMTPWSHQWRIITPSGRLKWLSGQGHPTRRPDDTIEWNSMIIDVTDRVLEEQQRARLEDQLRQAARMEGIGRLAGGIAHDFNNMLAVIRGNAEEALEVGSEPVRTHLGEILDATERSATLVRQLLAFARPSSLETVRVDLANHVATVVPLLDRMVGDTVTVRVDRDCESCFADINPSELDQVLTNLVTNARDTMEDGEVRIRVDCDRDESRCRLSVSDDGDGMPEHVAHHIFEPFFTTKSEGTHLGLGLATVYAIVRRAGGTIEVTSAPRAGTTFTVELPLSVDAEVEADEETPTEDLEEDHQSRVLLVDDEAPVRLVLGRLVRSLGYRVVAVDSGEAAIERLDREGHFDLMLSDVSMNGISGPELVGVVQRQHPGVACVLMSGYFAEGEPSTGYNGIPVLEKPFRRHELEDALQRALAAVAQSRPDRGDRTPGRGIPSVRSLRPDE